MWESLSESNLDTIARLYRDASDLDPLNAAAFAGLSQALIAEGVLGRVHTSHAYPPAIAALNRALQIHPDLFEVKCAGAFLKMMVERDWRGAREDFDEALVIGPATTIALVGRALHAIAQASLSDASMLLREATILRPLNSPVIALLCWSEYLAGRFEDALTMSVQARDTGHSSAVLDAVEALSSVLVDSSENQIERIESRAKGSPKHFGLLGVLGYSYGMTGQAQKAVELLDSMTESGMRGNCDYAYGIALTFLGMNNRPKTIEWLEESYRQGSLWSLAFLSDPILASLRDGSHSNHFFSRFHYPEVVLRRE